jgi:hypothetical protein
MEFLPFYGREMCSSWAGHPSAHPAAQKCTRVQGQAKSALLYCTQIIYSQIFVTAVKF